VNGLFIAKNQSVFVVCSKDPTAVKRATLLTSTLAGVALTLAAPFASAGLIYSGGSVAQGAGTVNVGGSSDAVTGTITWTQTAFSAYFDFASDALFNLVLSGYTPSAANSNVSGFTLDWLDAPGGTSRLTNDTSFCSGATAVIAGTCDLITGTANSGSNASGAAKPGSFLFSSLQAGEYRLGVYESSSPDQGSATFSIALSSPVPSPTPLLLMAASLAAFALRQRGRR